MPDVTVTLECVECGAMSDDGRGWRTYLVDEDAGETATYCPDCAEQEFGRDDG